MSQMIEALIRWIKRSVFIQSKCICIYFLLLIVGFLTSCSTTAVYAPVSDATIERIPKSGIILVKRNETLYSIAWRYGLDPYYVARRNQLTAPYAIYSGQKLNLKGQPLNQAPFPLVSKKTQKISSVMSSVKVNIPKTPVAVWNWPAKGPLIKGFSASNKGIDIGGRKGDPVFAAADGNVVYSGNELRGYGNLIIIAHNLSYMSAYAYNSNVYVIEGQRVKSGQKIAEMGRNGRQKVILHFEIRRLGKPVNPLRYLKSVSPYR
jgi:lipoprotein NlpD